MNNAPKIRLQAAGVAANGGLCFRREVLAIPGQSVELTLGHEIAHRLGLGAAPEPGTEFDLRLESAGGFELADGTDAPATAETEQADTTARATAAA